jgi:hypothetical protein
MKNKKEKPCQYCKETKKLSEFPKHRLYKDRLDTRCRECIKHHAKVRKKLKKEAPPRPEVCEICGKVPWKWVIDHDHTDDTFRGHVCSRCNEGLGKLGDDIPSLINALNYLIKVRNRNQLDKPQQ